VDKDSNCQQLQHGIFKRLSQDGGRADFSKNLRPSPFSKYLSHEPNFSRINLAGQYPYLEAERDPILLNNYVSNSMNQYDGMRPSSVQALIPTHFHKSFFNLAAATLREFFFISLLVGPDPNLN
jgi:hypothetical protein